MVLPQFGQKTTGIPGPFAASASSIDQECSDISLNDVCFVTIQRLSKKSEGDAVIRRAKKLGSSFFCVHSFWKKLKV